MLCLIHEQLSLHTQSTSGLTIIPYFIELKHLKLVSEQKRKDLDYVRFELDNMFFLDFNHFVVTMVLELLSMCP